MELTYFLKRGAQTRHLVVMIFSSIFLVENTNLRFYGQNHITVIAIFLDTYI